MGDLLYKAGYFSGSELDLRIDPNWEPRPAGALELEQPYPTKPIDVAIEILELANRTAITGEFLWQEFDRRLKRQ